MNRNESKYFNTAIKMDNALLKLLEKKDLEYITVKEICENAGVNRSTFYLHYETIDDLLSESIEYMNDHFQSYMNHNFESFTTRMHDCPIEELYFITPEYLKPYLCYIKENRCIFSAEIKNSKVLRLNESYDNLFRYIFTPILERYGVPQKNRKLIMSFYIHGLMAIITDWLKDDCRDTIEDIISTIQECISYKNPNK